MSRFAFPAVSAFALSALLLCSCMGSIGKRMDVIESQMETNPHNAYEELCGISSANLNTEALRARYSILMSLAMDKNYIDVSNDSLIQIAVHYYRDRNEPRYRMLAEYSLGRVQRNAGDNTGAIVSFLQAKTYAKQISDYHYWGLSARNIAQLYGECNDEDSELIYYKESRDAFKAGSNVRYAAYSQLGEARAYMAKGAFAAADSLLGFLEQYAHEGENNHLLQLVLKDQAYNNLSSPNGSPQKVIAKYREAERVGKLKKTTADYGTLALAHELMNHPDSVKLYLVKAEASCFSDLDSAHFYNKRALIYQHQGKYEQAIIQMKEVIALHNRMVFSRENQQIANAISDYSQQEAERYEALARLRLVFLILLCLALFVLCLVFFEVLRIRRRRIEEQNRIIKEKEQRIDEDLAHIQEISEELQNHRSSSSEMAKTINGLILEKIQIVKSCADVYDSVKNGERSGTGDPYRFLDKDPQKLKYEEMQRFLLSLQLFRRDDAMFEMMEESVNKWRGDIMQKLRRACAKESMQKPQFEEEDFRILMLLYSGIPATTIAFLMEMSHSAIRTRKTRYKERLQQSDIPDGKFFAQELACFPIV